MAVRVKFEGGPELVKALETLTNRMSIRVLRDSLEGVAEPMREHMSQLAPREPGAPDLADNIVIGPAKAKRSTGQAAAVAVGPERSFFYGWFQEFGTVFHGAQPFVRPAFDGGVMKAISDLARVMWTELAGRGVSRGAVTQLFDPDDGAFEAGGIGRGKASKRKLRPIPAPPRTRKR